MSCKLAPQATAGGPGPMWASLFNIPPPPTHTHMDCSAESGQGGYRVFFPFGEYTNISQLVLGPQTNIRAEVSGVRAALQAVHSDKDIRMYISKWCGDIFKEHRAI